MRWFDVEVVGGPQDGTVVSVPESACWLSCVEAVVIPPEMTRRGRPICDVSVAVMPIVLGIRGPGSDPEAWEAFMYADWSQRRYQ